MKSQNREIIIKLKLIGNLYIGSKLDTRYLIIQPDSIATKLSRYMYSENRRNTVIFCRNTIDQVIFLLSTGLEEPVKTEIIKDINAAKLGIQNLQETYSTDIRVQAELTEIIETINRSVPQQ